MPIQRGTLSRFDYVVLLQVRLPSNAKRRGASMAGEDAAGIDADLVVRVH
jgi:hypothetical protein